MKSIKDVNIYEKHEFLCDCGRVHTLPIGDVVIGAGAASRLPEFSDKLGKKGMLITDKRIYDSLGKDIYQGWLEHGLNVDLFVIEGRFTPNEETIGRVVCNVPFDCEYLISIGGGTVTDIVRYVATRLKLPGVSIPSAMTMDGFFTNMSVIIVNGFQRTYYLDYPALILADTDIIKTCPSFMNAAGVGEVVSKISAAMDWYSAKAVKGIYYCDNAANMMGQCISEGSNDDTCAGIATADEKAVWNLTDGLYKSAVGMAWYGSSPCGSGAEHQINHFWVMCQDNKGLRQTMHGQNVGVGAVVNMMLWSEIMKQELEQLDVEACLDKMWSKQDWEVQIRRVYGRGADDIFKVQEKNHTFDREERRKELEQIKQSAKALREKFNSMPTAQKLMEKLNSAGAPSKPQELGIDRADFIDSICYAKEMRNGRYNSLWLAEAIGILEIAAEKVADELGY